ncbi:MAG: hypothetical protein H8E36_07725 [Rhodospirillaceae bacterium]|nr:hypothetical protein [Rhodospirillaceae bacterium]
MMKQLTPTKKKNIIANLPVDDLDEKTWTGIDDAIYLYLCGIEHIERLPKDKAAEAAEIRRIQRKAVSAIQAIDELENSINRASSLMEHRSESKGLGKDLKLLTSKLSDWTAFEDEVRPREIGNRPKFFREKFIEHLAFLYKKITGEKATNFTGDDPRGKFFIFVMACASDLPGFNVDEASISTAIVRTFKN